MEKPKIPLPVVIIVVMIGVGVTGFGVWLLGRDLLFAVRATSVEGTVQPAPRLRSDKDTGRIAVRVAREGRSEEYRPEPGWAKPKAGQTVNMLVIPGQPEAARLDSVVERFLVPVGCFVVGAPVLCLAVWDFRKRRRYRADLRDRDRLTPALWKH